MESEEEKLIRLFLQRLSITQESTSTSNNPSVIGTNLGSIPTMGNALTQNGTVSTNGNHSLVFHNGKSTTPTKVSSEGSDLAKKLLGKRDDNVNSRSDSQQNGAHGNADEDNLSASEMLKRYQSQREASFLAEKNERLERDASSFQPRKQFNRNKVSRVIKDQIESLPIFAKKDELLKLVKENQMVIVIGETGSGKSTQIPQYLVDAGYAVKGKIGITQPRRVAAKSLADRVSKECGVPLGSLVGYSVRFDKAFSDETIIKYMTDGLLVKECTSDPNLLGYSVIIIDEAHERSIHSDICFGLLKRAAAVRPDLKIIISSATLEDKKFSRYFNNAPIFNVSGRGHEVEILYEPKKEAEYVQGVVDTILKIHRTHRNGDILVFLAGQDEIEEVWDLLENKIVAQRLSDKQLLILPCYGALPFEEQQKIFEETPSGMRKVVLATNIAETSITIDGVVYVIDCGYFKQSEYNFRSGIYSLVKQKIAKHQAVQRAGRAGRTCPGKCYRLYPKLQFDTLKEANIPEIKRCNLESVLLDLIAMGVANPATFEFMDQPNLESILEGMEHLKEMQALDSELKLTMLGRRMSQFPLDPPLARVVLESVNLGCSADILKIVAILSIQYSRLFSRPKNRRAEADQTKAKFNHPEGDHLSFLKVYDDWESSNYSEDWCRYNFLQYRYLCEAEEIRIQLRDILQSQNLPELASRYWNMAMTEKIRKAFTAGYFRKVARKSLRGYGYKSTGLNPFALEELYLQRSSCLFSIQPARQFVMYHEVIKTSKAFMRGVIEIDPNWVKEYAPDYAKKVRFMQ